MAYWWEDHPGRLEWEIARLEAAGITVREVVALKNKGIVALDLQYAPAGETIELRAVFPEQYPYFKPEVFALELNLDRHQNLADKNLCLLGRSTAKWMPGEPKDNLADLLTEQLPKILAINDGADEEAIKNIEEPQGEPFTDYFRYLTSSTLSIDTSWNISSDIKNGTLDIEATVDVSDFDNPFFRGVVTAVRDPDGNVLEAWQGQVPDGYNIAFRSIPWKRSKEQPRIFNSDAFCDGFVGKDKKGRPTPPTGGKIVGKRLATYICAVLFDEEIHQMEYGDGWVIAGIFHSLNRKGHVKEHRTGFIRAQRAGEVDLNSRVPARRAFSGKTIVVIGAGAIGAPLILDMARNGVSKIHIVDHDIVEPGTVPRWVLGVRAHGVNKAHAIEEFLGENYPDVSIIPHLERIGGLPSKDETTGEFKSQVTLLEGIIGEADLVIDATAEVGVHRYLSNLCLGMKKPLICPSATPGAWGGMVVRCLPTAGKGCWQCFEHHIEDGAIPIPESQEDGGGIQPPGCADRTFLGASFDIMEIVLEAMRLVAGTLSEADDDYPNSDWDVSVASLQNVDGRMAPKWEVAELPQHKDCMVCQGKR